MPQSWSLAIRRHGAKVYHLGGVHSGCAIFAVGWRLWLTITITQSAFSDPPVVCSNFIPMSYLSGPANIL
jgi:hypothetical protein